MKNFKIGCSPITGEIFAGNVLKNGMWGQSKHNVTKTAVGAVSQHLLHHDVKVLFTYKGEKHVLQVTKLETK